MSGAGRRAPDHSRGHSGDRTGAGPEAGGRCLGPPYGALEAGVDAVNRAVSAADVAGDVHGGALEAGTVEAVALAKRGGAAIHIIAGSAGQAGGGGAGPPRLQMVNEHMEAQSCGRWQVYIPGEG